jgi:hypothetical protein
MDQRSSINLVLPQEAFCKVECTEYQFNESLMSCKTIFDTQIMNLHYFLWLKSNKYLIVTKLLIVTKSSNGTVVHSKSVLTVYIKCIRCIQVVVLVDGVYK